ncbi:MAG: hypothetical protein IT547_01040 [Hyphomonadaceae bacterium]|nr:hypothetical protein [Hyphomonadaceae bacterium]
MTEALPATVSYRPIRFSLIVRALLGFAFVAVIIWATHLGWTNGRAGFLTVFVMGGCAAFFTYVSTGYLSQLGDENSLTLDGEGFSYRAAWKRQRIAWRDVSEFKVVRHRSVEGIAFDLPTAASNWMRHLNRNAVGFSEFMMPHAFDAPIHDVCETLNAFRTRALGTP